MIFLYLMCNIMLRNLKKILDQILKGKSWKGKRFTGLQTHRHIHRLTKKKQVLRSPSTSTTPHHVTISMLWGKQRNKLLAAIYLRLSSLCREHGMNTNLFVFCFFFCFCFSVFTIIIKNELNSWSSFVGLVL